TGREVRPARGSLPLPAVRLLEHAPRQQAHGRRPVAQARAGGRSGAGGLVKFAGRREDPRLLKGEGRYTADWNFPGQLYGAFLRSDRAHARITGIDTVTARAMPGVVAVYTGEDVRHLKTPPPQIKYPGRGGVHLQVPERPIL